MSESGGSALVYSCTLVVWRHGIHMFMPCGIYVTIPCIFLYSVYQATNASYKIQRNTNHRKQYITSTKLVYVTAPEVYRNEGIQVQHANLGWHRGTETCRSLVLVTNCLL